MRFHPQMKLIELKVKRKKSPKSTRFGGLHIFYIIGLMNRKVFFHRLRETAVKISRNMLSSKAMTQDYPFGIFLKLIKNMKKIIVMFVFLLEPIEVTQDCRRMKCGSFGCRAIEVQER